MNNFFTLNGEIAAVQVGVKNLEISADFDTDAGVKKFCEDLAARSAFILRACVSLFYFRLPNSPKLEAV